MPIIGTTIGEDGSLIQSLPVTTKIACGLAPSGQRNFPERLFKFVYMRRGTGKEWVLDEELMAHYYPNCSHQDVSEQCDKCCTSVNITIMEDPIMDSKGNLDFENILKTNLIWYGQSGWKCRGDGVNAIRKTDKAPDGEPWSPCREGGCPNFDKECKPSGDLYCALSDHFRLSGVARIHTSSEWSIRNMHSSLLQLARGFTGGRLAGLTLTLKVVKEKVSFQDKNGKTISTTVPILRFADTSVEDLVSRSVHTMDLFQSVKKAFGNKRLVPVEDEADLAKEIPPEFNPQEQPQLPAAPEQAATPTVAESFKGKAPEKPAIQPSPPPLTENTAAVKPPADTAKPEPPKAPTAPPSGGTPPSGGPTSPPAPRLTYDGTVSGIKAKRTRIKTDGEGNTIKAAESYWEIELSNPADEKTLPIKMLTKEQKVFDTAESARKSGREVQIVCEVREEKEVRALKAVEVTFFNRTPPEPEKQLNGTEESDWALD